MNGRAPRSAAPLLLTVLLPLEVEVGPGAPADSEVEGSPVHAVEDPSYEFDVLAGSGRFAIVPRSCGPEPLPIFEARSTEAAVAVTRTSSDGVVLGIRGGWIHDEIDESDRSLVPAGETPDRDILYLNPWIGVEKRWFGLRGGGVLSSEEFPTNDGDDENIPLSAGLRLGPPPLFGFVSLMEGMPLQTGGGYVRLGLGTSRPGRYEVWAAAAGDPQDGGLALGADVRVAPRVSLLVRGRIGESEGISENSFAGGLRFHSMPPPK